MEPQMHADARKSNNAVMRPRFCASTCFVVTLLFVGLAPGWQVYLLAEGVCPEQPDYRAQYVAANADEPNLVGDYAGLPVLGLPGNSGPTVWSAPCGPGRWGYTACDPEGQQMSGEIVSSDIPAEMTIAADGRATLTVLHVTPEWHVIRVRITDVPPPDCLTPASRDVLIVFRGEEGQNLPPVLLGIWGGTS